MSQSDRKCEYNYASYDRTNDIEIIISGLFMLLIFITALLAISSNIVRYLIK